MICKSVRRETVTAADLKSAQNRSKKRKRKSLTRAAQQRFVARAKKRGLMKRALPHSPASVVPTKLQQLDAQMRAGMASDPLRNESATGTATDLTARVRALYEAGVVPVRELARLVGVSERTLYKYAARGSWRGRYARRALAKGTGGRFVAQGEAASHAPAGLKALDPVTAQAACAVCEEAGTVARRTAAATLADHAAREARAAVLRDFETRVRRLALLTRTLKLLGARMP